MKEDDALWKEVFARKYSFKKRDWIPKPRGLNKGSWKSIFRACYTSDKWYQSKGDELGRISG